MHVSCLLRRCRVKSRRWLDESSKTWVVIGARQQRPGFDRRVIGKSAKDEAGRGPQILVINGRLLTQPLTVFVSPACCITRSRVPATLEKFFGRFTRSFHLALFPKRHFFDYLLNGKHQSVLHPVPHGCSKFRRVARNIPVQDARDRNRYLLFDHLYEAQSKTVGS